MAKTAADQIREAAESSLEMFIRLVSPKQVLGSVHEDVCRWWTRQGRKSHQLLLLPRDHGKSRLIAYRCAWEITRRPEVRILYISATANLAEKQLAMIQQILLSPIYRRYWPEMVNQEESKRARWTNSEIKVDHPKRAEEGVADPTVFTGGLTTSLTGFHCDIAVLDDVVVQENAYTIIGRDKVEAQYSLLSSIEGGDAEEWVCGTRYHPKDLYSKMLEMEEELFDDDGNVCGSEPIYEIFERTVEDRGDGTGEFLWPRQQRSDGKWFGFDSKILSVKRGKYLDRTQFRAQYYNDPNDPGDAFVGRDKFQYYDTKFLNNVSGRWFYREHRLNVYAAIDFSYTTGKRSDFTSIVVVGLDSDQNVYVLDIERFKTSKLSDMYDRLLDLHVKWDFRKVAAEVTAGQKVIVQELKDQYIRPAGLYLSVDERKHSAHEGSKKERVEAILEPRYNNQSVWHYRGGNCQVLEDELLVQHSSHDDVKDALATCLEIAVAPTGMFQRERRGTGNVVYNTRFGGIAR